MDKELKGTIGRAKDRYKKIVCVRCVALNDENIYFRDSGFNHLIRKGGVIRPHKDILRRIYLLSHAVSIIQSTKKYSGYRKSTRHDSTGKNTSVAHFWSLEKVIGGRKVRVVVRQVNKEQKHFFSVMETN